MASLRKPGRLGATRRCRVTAKRVTAKRVTAKRVTAKRVTAKRVTAKRGLAAAAYEPDGFATA